MSNGWKLQSCFGAIPECGTVFSRGLVVCSTYSSRHQCSGLAYGVRRFIAAFFAFADGTDHRKVVCQISSRRQRKRESIPALQNSQTLFRTPRGRVRNSVRARVGRVFDLPF